MSKDTKTLNITPQIIAVVNGVTARLAASNPQLDLQELRGEAWIETVDILRRFNGEGTVEGWLSWSLRRRLVKQLTESPGWLRRVSKQCTLGPLQYTVPARSCFDLYALLWQVSADARQVIQLALQESSPAVVMYRRLREAGWAQERVTRAFTEIREALGYGTRLCD